MSKWKYRFQKKARKPKPSLRVCKLCQQTKAKADFYLSPESTRATQYCSACRIAREALARTYSTWGWANAELKAVSMRISRTGEPWTGMLSVPDIYAIMELQDYRCALSSVPLVYPEGPLPLYTTLDAWSKEEGLRAKDQLWLPTLVKAHPDSGWNPGNVVIVARTFADMCRLMPGIVAVRKVLNLTNTVVIPTREDIAEGHQKLLVAAVRQERG